MLLRFVSECRYTFRWTQSSEIDLGRYTQKFMDVGQIYYNYIGFENSSAENKSGIRCLQEAKYLFILSIFALVVAPTYFILNRFRSRILVFSMDIATNVKPARYLFTCLFCIFGRVVLRVLVNGAALFVRRDRRLLIFRVSRKSSSTSAIIWIDKPTS